MPAFTLDQLRNLGPEFPLFSLASFIASTKRRDARDRYRAIARTLIDFLHANNLATPTLADVGDDVPDDLSIRVCDLTDDGLRFYAVAEQRWLQSLDRGGLINDTRLLTDVLTSVRDK